MKKGIFSGIIILFSLVLVLATIIYSTLPVQELKTVSEAEATRNLQFTAQAARYFADKAFAETVYDEMIATRTTTGACTVTFSKSSIEGRFQNYLHPASVDFGNCRLDFNPTPGISFPLGPVSGGTLTTDVAVFCEIPNDVSSPKKISFKKIYHYEKNIFLFGFGGCLIITVADKDSGLGDFAIIS